MNRWTRWGFDGAPTSKSSKYSPPQVPAAPLSEDPAMAFEFWTFWTSINFSVSQESLELEAGKTFLTVRNRTQMLLLGKSKGQAMTSGNSPRVPDLVEISHSWEWKGQNGVNESWSAAITKMDWHDTELQCMECPPECHDRWADRFHHGKSPDRDCSRDSDQVISSAQYSKMKRLQRWEKNMQWRHETFYEF